MSESEYQKTAQKDLSKAPREDFEATLRSLVESGHISVDVGDGEVVKRMAITAEKAKSAAKILSTGKETEPLEPKKELSPEQVEAWLGELKTRFDSLSQLHKGVKWADVEKSLKADTESMAKLQALDEKGHAMNVFGEEKGEFIFASAWEDSKKVSAEHRKITFDLKGEKFAEKQDYKPTGNAISIIARIMGVKEDEAGNYLADPKFHEQLRKAVAVNGWAWLKTDSATREYGNAFDGDYRGVYGGNASGHSNLGSFRASLRVKKA
jgi:hypothetical protein